MRKLAMRPSSALKKTRECSLSLLTCVMMGALVCSCSDRIHVIPDDEEPGVPVTIRVASLEQEPFGPFGTKAANLKDACSVISYVIYNSSGDEICKPQVNQKSDDESFGTLNVKLEEGEYKLVILAHSSGSNPLMTELSKVDFKTSQKTLRVTDTFLYNGNITVVKGMNPLNLNLDRVVAKFELRFTNEFVPDDVKTIEVQFDNEASWSLNANTGLGTRPASSSSRYTEKVGVNPGDSVVEVFTFICNSPTASNINIVAKDSLGAEYKKMELKKVPLTKNRITVYRGVFFGKEPITMGATVSVNDEWAGTDSYSLND